MVGFALQQVDVGAYRCRGCGLKTRTYGPDVEAPSRVRLPNNRPLKIQNTPGVLFPSPMERIPGSGQCALLPKGRHSGL